MQINFRDSILPSQLTFRRFDTNGEEEGETFSTSTKDKDMDTEQFSDDRQSEIQSLKLTFQNALTELEEINSLFLTPGGQVTASVKLKLLKYKFNLM